MEQAATRFLNVSDREGTSLRIAYENARVPNTPEPGMVWFPGLNSTMTSTKVTALKQWAARSSRSFLCFEYSGHGSSEGEFSDGTIGQWLRESLAILHEVAKGPQILIGSSMGAWLILLILRAIARGAPEVRNLGVIEGAVLIAPAFDLTEELMWNQFTDEAREALELDGYYLRPSKYGDGDYKITRNLIEEGRNHLIGNDTFRPPCPVRILHGIDDPDVPWRHANRLTQILTGENVMLSLIQKGDHRLSRPRDIEKMIVIVDDLFVSIADSRCLV